MSTTSTELEDLFMSMATPSRRICQHTRPDQCTMDALWRVTLQPCRCGMDLCDPHRRVEEVWMNAKFMADVPLACMSCDTEITGISWNRA